MDFPHLVLARVYEHIEPLDRGDRYEDPLQATLEKMEIGRVTGGGSQLNELREIAYADVEIELANLDEALGIVAEALETAGHRRAPSSCRGRMTECCANSANCNAWRFTWTGQAYPTRSMPTSILKRSSERSAQPPVTTATADFGKVLRKLACSSSDQMPKRCSRASSRFSDLSRSARMLA
jgi:hypothetical protein